MEIVSIITDKIASNLPEIRLASPACTSGAMLGHGVLSHHPEVFAELAIAYASSGEGPEVIHLDLP